MNRRRSWTFGESEEVVRKAALDSRKAQIRLQVQKRIVMNWEHEKEPILASQRLPSLCVFREPELRPQGRPILLR